MKNFISAADRRKRSCSTLLQHLFLPLCIVLVLLQLAHLPSVLGNTDSVTGETDVTGTLHHLEDEQVPRATQSLQFSDEDLHNTSQHQEVSQPRPEDESNESLQIPSATVAKVVQCTKDKGYNYRPDGYVVPESRLAHELLDDYCGIEIGAGACNPFGLNTVQVGLTEEMDPIDYAHFKQGQLKYCGDYAKIDVPGDAMDLHQFVPSSLEYILHSHIWEHVPNPLKALEEWVRVLQHNGLLYIVVPHRCAAASDCERNVTTLRDLIYYYEIDATLDDFINEETGRLKHRIAKDNYHRGHLIVFTPDLLIDIMLWFNQKYYDQHISLRLISFLYRDDKIGNGHQVTWQVIKDENRTKEEVIMHRSG